METVRGSVLVFERKPKWLPELQRQFQGGGWLVRGVETYREAVSLTKSANLDCLVLDFVRHPSESLQLLGSGLGQNHFPGVLALVGAASRDLEWVIRELGFGGATVFRSPLSGEELAEQCRRFVDFRREEKDLGVVNLGSS